MARRTEHGLQALHRSPTCAYICRLHASSAARTQHLLIWLRYLGGVTSEVSENLPRDSSRATLDPEHGQAANDGGPEILRGKANGRSVWYLLQSIFCEASGVPPPLKAHREDTLATTCSGQNLRVGLVVCTASTYEVCMNCIAGHMSATGTSSSLQCRSQAVMPALRMRSFEVLRNRSLGSATRDTVSEHARMGHRVRYSEGMCQLCDC